MPCLQEGARIPATAEDGSLYNPYLSLMEEGGLYEVLQVRGGEGRGGGGRGSAQAQMGGVRTQQQQGMGAPRERAGAADAVPRPPWQRAAEGEAGSCSCRGQGQGPLGAGVSSARRRRLQRLPRSWLSCAFACLPAPHVLLPLPLPAGPQEIKDKGGGAGDEASTMLDRHPSSKM